MLRRSLIAIPKQIIVHFYFVAMQFCKLLTLIRFALHLCDHLKMRMSAISPLFSTGEHLKLSNSRKYCFIATSTMLSLRISLVKSNWMCCDSLSGTFSTWIITVQSETEIIDFKILQSKVDQTRCTVYTKVIRRRQYETACSTQNVLMFWLFFGKTKLS